MDGPFNIIINQHVWNKRHRIQFSQRPLLSGAYGTKARCKGEHERRQHGLRRHGLAVAERQRAMSATTPAELILIAAGPAALQVQGMHEAH
jgi:hypothetical protein